MAKLKDILKNMSPDTRALNPSLVASDSEIGRNKYGAQPTNVDNKKFASKKEALRFMELRSMEARGEISALEAHPTYTLMESFHDNEGKYVSSITYTPDFRYVKNGVIYIEDVKSEATQTEAFRIRWRLLQSMMRNNRGVRLRIV